jgi:hypothetical protein
MSSTKSELPTVVRTVRSTLRDTIRTAFEADHPVVVEALPASGKSRGVVEWASQTGNQLTILTGRHDVRDQYEEWAEEFGVSFGHVPSQRRDCPLGAKYSGDVEVPADGTDWEEEFKSLLTQYGTAYRAHKNHDGLPCQADGDCPYVEKHRDFDASTYDVIAGHYLHVYSSYPEFPNPEGRYIEDRYVAFDEFPEEDLIKNVEGYKQVVTGLLETTPELPYDTFGELEVAAHTGSDAGDRSLIDTWLSKNERNLFDPKLSGHADRNDPNAPALLRAALTREPLSNGWWRADLGSRACVTMDGENAFILRQPSTDTLARSVVALDGTPSIELWRILLGENTELESVHGNDEGRREYLREGLRIRFIQTSESTKPYGNADTLVKQRPEGSSEYVDDDRVAQKDMLAFRWIAQQEADAGPLGFISTKSAIEIYGGYRLDEFVAVQGHYGDLKGSNEFGDIRTGIVAGCNEPSHPRIQIWGAFAGESLKPQKGENGTILRGARKTFGEYGDQIMVALRENQVLQVAMRFAREPERDQQSAHVYLHTAAIPGWVEPEQTILRPRLWKQSKGMGQVLTVIRDDLSEDSWRTGDVIEAIERRYGGDKKTKRTTQNCLKQLRESDTVPYSRPTGEGSGSGRAYVYNTPDTFEGRMLVHHDGYVLGPDSVISRPTNTT